MHLYKLDVYVCNIMKKPSLSPYTLLKGAL